jgi:hypothetical protein
MAIGYIIGAIPMIVDVADFPAEGDVEKDVVYDDGAKTGTFEAPTEEDVEEGVSYGADGTEYTGTFIPIYAGQDLIGYLEESVDLTGELEP